MWRGSERLIRVSALLAALCVLALAGCTRPTTFSVSGKAMGTTWQATLVTDGSTLPAHRVQDIIQQRLDELEAIFTNWRPESAVSRFNTSTSMDWQPVPRELAEVVSFAQQVSQETGGAFDVTICPLIDLWGFGAKGRITTPPSPERVAEVKASCGWQKLAVKMDPPSLRKAEPTLQINVSALVEGYAVDDLARKLSALNLKGFLLDMGGEIFAHGVRAEGQPWQVGVQQPDPDADKGTIMGTMELQGQALATSGTYRQFFQSGGQPYAHVLDARTGMPVTHEIVSVSVVSDRCFTADTWATALLAMRPDEARSTAVRLGIDALMLARPEGL